MAGGSEISLKYDKEVNCRLGANLTHKSTRIKSSKFALFLFLKTLMTNLITFIGSQPAVSLETVLENNYSV